ncbi:unnamed protein product, partial [Ectocarpus sp. 12 AP-2014]
MLRDAATCFQTRKITQEECYPAEMPKPYKRKNRYCRNTKLSEAEFEQVLTGFLAGMGAAAVSRDMERSEKTVRTMFARLREWLADDSELMGWMG